MHRLASTLSLCALLFTAVFWIYSKSEVINSNDSVWTIYTARSLLLEGDLELSEYREVARAKKFHGLRRAPGGIYNFFPVGTALMSLPFVALFEAAPTFWVSVLPGFDAKHVEQTLAKKGELTSTNMRLPLERCIASIFVALSVVLVCLSLNEIVGASASLLLSIAYAFCTSAWSNASRGLWAHAPIMLLYALALYICLRARKDSSLVQYAALPLAMSYIVRPTAIIAIFVFTLFVFVSYRKHFFRYVLWLVLPLLAFSISSLIVYGQFLPHYYSSSRIMIHQRFLQAVLGNLFSPARGLFILSPFLLLSIIGWFAACRWRNESNQDSWLSGFLLLATFLHLIAVSMLPAWSGGHCFGARYMGDILPFLMVLLGMLLARLGNVSAILRGSTYAVLLLSCLTSSYIHYRGANARSVYAWNMTPVNVDQIPERVWDWHDQQFKR